MIAARQNAPGVGFDFEMGGVVEIGDGLDGLDELFARGAQGADGFRIDGDMKVNAPGVGVVPVGFGVEGELRGEIDETEEFSVIGATDGLVQVARLRVSSQEFPTFPIGCGAIELQCTGDVQFIDANACLIDGSD